MNPHRIDGPLIKNRREKPKLEFRHMIKGLAAVMDKDILPDVKMPILRKARGPDKGPRQFPEAQLRKDMIKWLNKNGWRWWRIENSIIGRSSGLPDFIIAKDNKMIFMELKGTGGLTGLQPEFRDWCQRCGVNYMVAKGVEDVQSIR